MVCRHVVEGQRKAGGGGGEVGGSAWCGGGERAEGNHRFGIGLLGSRLQQPQAVITVLTHTATVDVAFCLSHRIIRLCTCGRLRSEWLRSCGLSRDRFRSSRSFFLTGFPARL